MKNDIVGAISEAYDRYTGAEGQDDPGPSGFNPEEESAQADQRPAASAFVKLASMAFKLEAGLEKAEFRDLDEALRAMRATLESAAREPRDRKTFDTVNGKAEKKFEQKTKKANSSSEKAIEPVRLDRDFAMKKCRRVERWRRSLFFCTLALLGSLGSATWQEKDWQRIIERLDADSPEDRDRAEAELVRVAETAKQEDLEQIISELRKVSSAEQKDRAARILRQVKGLRRIAELPIGTAAKDLLRPFALQFVAPDPDTCEEALTEIANTPAFKSLPQVDRLVILRSLHVLQYGRDNEKIDALKLIKALHTVDQTVPREDRELVLELTRDKHSLVRYHALAALAVINPAAAAERLRSALKDEEPTIRKLAIRLLAPAQDAHEAIGALLSDDDADVRLQAVEALIASPMAGVRNRLEGAAFDAEYKVRERALQLLARQGRERLVALLRAALNSPDPKRRCAAADGLRQINERDACTDIAKLLSDRDESVRRYAVAALASLDGKRRVPAIALLLSDPDYEMRQAALEALASIQAKEAFRDITQLLADRKAYVRESALIALISLADENQARELAHSLSNMLGDRYSEVRRLAAYAIGRFKVEAAAQNLAAMAVSDNEDVVDKEQAILGLGRLGRSADAKTLMALCRHPEWSLRLAAMRALAMHGSAAETLEQLLEDSDSRVRTEAARLLFVMGKRYKDKKLFADLNSSDGLLRAEAVRRAGLIGEDSLHEAIIPLADDPAPEVRREAAWWIGFRRMKDSRGILIRLLRDPDYGARYWALKGLAVMRAVDEAGAIAKLLCDEEPGIRARAIRTLAELGAREYTKQFREHAGDASQPDEVRAAAVYALALLGDREGLRSIGIGGIPQDAPVITLLNGLTFRETMAVPLSSQDSVYGKTIREIIEHIAALTKRRLRFDYMPLVAVVPYPWCLEVPPPEQLYGWSALEVLEHLSSNKWPGRDPFGFIINGEELVVTRLATAIEHWEKELR